MTTRFLGCLQVVLKNEGGLSDVKEDRGGSTNYGVIQTTYDSYRTSKSLYRRPVKDIEQSEVEEIYLEYWMSASCDKLPEPLDLLVFDMAINSGSGRAIKTLQKCMAIVVDGAFGRNSLNSLGNYLIHQSVVDLCQKYLLEREEFYDDIVERDPSQQVFLRGWKNRLTVLSKESNLA